jgi:hypothetical protein
MMLPDVWLGPLSGIAIAGQIARGSERFRFIAFLAI